VAFPGIVDELFVTVRPLADKYGSTLNLETAMPSVSIVSDPRRVRQILLNLLSNAIKFGGRKPIAVRVAGTPEQGVCVEVRDQGEGIPAEDQERIFHEFVQLGKTQLQEGTGLGLPISRRLAELLHGSLTLDSQMGKGSTFRLLLPASLDVNGGNGGNGRPFDQEQPLRPTDERRRAAPDDAPAPAPGSAAPAPP
jgi:signal transduction histidine kinase